MTVLKQIKRVYDDNLTINLPKEFKNHIVEVIVIMEDEKNKYSASLKNAANLLLDDYINDEELTAFKLLDGDSFYE